ncbi:hypothetical protein LTR91_026620 [Friedmanniomyces endolithicus]|uniref:Multifunctional methyltransferase subunit trm112 n=1 Tax=Friedmanniomyces endolithicus TaxID=329885 RepID=A0AAN6GXP8_9PEZI|nr:hypothetical protein LTR94_003639 [Friedmanniomyces endolithicus]KAK0812176.1 hypothetical protein LTR59_001652 [Friedmanniomyces endolithicus]KAK0819243.1 hypothetical protein LTR38_000686 [Friedmanniomyces endolithicus]KAK0821765.1 hypothetical protein LTR75_000422 [Friedmanniomyces endolithicus]KAK0852496.1 hypothetical protein LTR03_003474 [Friedmanniomyces endolithicus]
MKLLTLNFLTCARKTCKSSPASFPLHPKDAELEQVETEMNAVFLRNILPRLEWEAMRSITTELGLPNLPAETPASEDLVEKDGDGDEATGGPPSQIARDLHALLMETCIASGKLVCGNCGHEYAVKEGIANFLLPSHMV